MSHCECNVTEEIKLTTFTQYVMSGSSPVISRVKGGSQVRNRVVFEAEIFRVSMTEGRPNNYEHNFIAQLIECSQN